MAEILIHNNEKYYMLCEFNNYYINKLGIILRRTPTLKVLKQTITKLGYKKVTLRVNNYRKTIFVHRLVAQTFI